jgi:hypothetical protein
MCIEAQKLIWCVYDATTNMCGQIKIKEETCRHGCKIFYFSNF